MKNLLICLIIVGFVIHTNAQDQKISTLATVGVTSPILDSGLGFHVGINPSFRVSEKFSGEGQISYMYTRIKSSFLSGDTGFVSTVNTLVGGRYYLSTEDKETRFFLNFLIGINYINEEENGIEKDGELNVGLSAGSFVDFNGIIIGLTYDTPQNMVLKVGYSF
ncbi:MAG: hypothetical protein R2795_00970 [Saprospiraceae bacterium]